MLNLGKSPSGHREVFVAQPDNVTEKMAGKIFILFELDTKKSEAKKIMDFLINGVEEYYYQDEKIFLRDKIEGLELENIFEAFLTKLNKALTEFLIYEKIRVKSSDFNVTIGLIYENQLLFSNFGKNKAYLIFRKKDQYEIINIEASASDIETIDYDDDSVSEKMKHFKIFSSVISGEIPSHSYFFFTNENLPEYLSNKEMVLIVSKLPPMVAAEQMKQSLLKVNAFAPFLALIIKNTYGLSEEDKKDEIIENITAHGSVSSLKNTEKKTEEMLAPSGFLNFSKIKDFFTSTISSISSIYKKIFSFFKKEDKKVKQAVKETLEKNKKEEIKTEKKPTIDIKTKIEVVRSSSILNKFFSNFKNIFLNLFSLSSWSNNFSNFFKNITSMHPKRKLLIALALVLVIILTLSITITNQQKRMREHEENFFKTISSLESRYDLIESYLLYNNEDGAKIIIGEISEEISNLVALNDEQEEVLKKWQEKLALERAKVQRLSIVDEKEKLFDLSDFNPSAEPRNIILNDNFLYITDPLGKTIYTYDILNNENSSILFNADGDISLDYPFFHNNRIYYYNVDKLVSININTGQYNELNIPGLTNNELTRFEIFSSQGPVEGNDLLYTLYSGTNAIYRYTPANVFNQYTSWLQDSTDLSLAVDMAITGPIWILKSDGEILRLYLGSLDNDFSFASVDPPINSASKLLADADNLYLFDLNSLRLIIYNQMTGNLLSQYKFPNISNVYDISIDFDNNYVYILANTSIYKFSIE